jgi:NADPH:quinone reductase-like Zn-dependent oxidoreductase
VKAIVYHQYGSPEVLKCEEIEKPTAGDDEVLIRVRAASVNPLDWHFMRGAPYMMRMMSGLRKPETTSLGVDLAGQVEAVGRNATQFQPGDEVFGASRGVMSPGGTYILVGGIGGRSIGPLAHGLKAVLLSRFVSQNLVMFLASANNKDLVALKELVETRKVTPVIDRTYPLSEVPEAIRYLEEGHARGKGVIALWT